MARIKLLTLNDLRPNFLRDFTRAQLVEKRWRLTDGIWQIEPCHFIDDWDGAEKAEKVKLLRETARMGGVVWGAYIRGKLVGFASLEPSYFGSERQYLLLHFLHVDAAWRGKGIGRELFSAAAAEAKARGAKKMYISASSAVETQAFYLNAGCRDAAEINPVLAEQEPFDRQMEYSLA